MFAFEKLEVYKRTIIFVNVIYKITRNFPKSELYGLTSQLQRAATSIALNIAEGQGRHHTKDFQRFLRMAVGSMHETIVCLNLAQKQDYINKEIYKKLYREAEQITKMLHGLRKSIS